MVPKQRKMTVLITFGLVWCEYQNLRGKMYNSLGKTAKLEAILDLLGVNLPQAFLCTEVLFTLPRATIKSCLLNPVGKSTRPISSHVYFHRTLVTCKI